MSAQILNSLGLILSIIGTIFVFKWGLSRQPQSFSFGLEDNNIISTKWGKMTGKDAKQKDAHEEIKYKRLSKSGLSLIAIGFILQLFAVWIPYLSSHQ
ncbi:MAG TPA: hypothetical protein VHG89_00600 [Verrucomicrobiae bacterium]|nr:hypothetical protein [Verrucomicrobiae bacterium]